MPMTVKSVPRVGSAGSVHLTETCEQDSPHLITHVETTTAPVTDDARTTTSHERLTQKDLLPEQHIVESGYVDAQWLHSSQQDFGIDLVGPTHPDVNWQAQQKTGFEAGRFSLAGQAEQATGPRSVIPVSVGPQLLPIAQMRSSRIKFSMKDCQSCPSRQMSYPRHTLPTS
jgi:hypothetical protein